VPVDGGRRAARNVDCIVFTPAEIKLFIFDDLAFDFRPP
jgi:hypothetical protein